MENGMVTGDDRVGMSTVGKKPDRVQHSSKIASGGTTAHVNSVFAVKSTNLLEGFPARLRWGNGRMADTVGQY